MLEEIEIYINNGYEPYYHINDEEDHSTYDEVRHFVLTEEFIKESFSTITFYTSVELIKGDVKILYVADLEESYEIQIEDIFNVIARIDEAPEDIQPKIFEGLRLYLKATIGDKAVVVAPKLDQNIYLDDPYFDTTEHIASMAYYGCKNLEVDKYFMSDFLDFKVGIGELYDNRGVPLEKKSLSEHGLVLLLLALSDEFMNVPMSQDCADYYGRKLTELAEKGNYDAIFQLGYDYYEGTHGFEHNYVKSEEALYKAYTMREDPLVANTLGYIYYYGRASDGIPEKEKAFQYFAIAHFAGGFYEATYKLADCYLNGYGTPKSERAAFRLVDSIIEENYHHYMNGNVQCKYADVCLRMARYYEKGIGTEPNPNYAHAFYHFARTAIKERLLDVSEYPGDRHVAISIFESLMAFEKQEGKQPIERIIDCNGYVISDKPRDFSGDHFRFEFSRDIQTSFLQLQISSTAGDRYMDATFPGIEFVERADVMTFILKVEADDELIEKLNNNKIGFLHLDEFCLSVIYEDENVPSDTLNLEENGLIYVPIYMERLERCYTVVGVTFHKDDDHIYYYLYKGKDSPAINDTLTVDSKGKEVEVFVKETYLLYEDELPLPLSLMGIARDHYFA